MIIWGSGGASVVGLANAEHVYKDEILSLHEKGIIFDAVCLH